MTLPSDAPQHEAEAGFSLLEMLVVLTILGLVTAVAAASSLDLSGRREMDRASRELAGLLREARSEAMLAGGDAVVTVDVEAGRASASWSDRVVPLPEGAAVEVLSAREELVSDSAPAFRFFADGGATGGSVRLRTEGAAAEIGVDWLTGKVERRVGSP